MSAPKDNFFVSIIMPCLNEAFSIESCVRQALMAAKLLDFQCEVIVVDNGSTDETATLAKKAGATVVHCPKKGYGAAVQYGISASKGTIIIVGDGDGSYDFSNLSPFILPLINEDGIVLGNRFNEQSPMPGAMPWSHRIIGNPLLTGLLNIIHRSDIKDAHCGLRSFTKSIYQKISPVSKGFEFCSEMLIRATRSNVPIAQVSIVLHCTHSERSSKLRKYKDGFRHILVIFFFIFGRRTGSRFLYLFKMV